MSLFVQDDFTLTIPEQSQLAILEQTIESGLKTFVDVGTALMVVRDSKLYRQEYGTFEDYCRMRWNMGKSRVYQMIDAATVVQNLVEASDEKSKILDFLPNESQARVLAKLPPEEQHEAFTKAIITAPDGKMTAAHMQQVVDEYDAPGTMAVHYSSKTDLWSTPQILFDVLNQEFHFNLDVCATDENTKCARYFTEQQDGLAQDWQGICWMNPPYGDDIPFWVAKAHASADAGAVVVCLVPARTDTAWWWDHCIEGEIRFLRGRLKFGDGKGSAPFPSAVVIFRAFVLPVHKKVVWWNYHV